MPNIKLSKTEIQTISDIVADSMLRGATHQEAIKNAAKKAAGMVELFLENGSMPFVVSDLVDEMLKNRKAEIDAIIRDCIYAKLDALLNDTNIEQLTKAAAFRFIEEKFEDG